MSSKQIIVLAISKVAIGWNFYSIFSVGYIGIGRFVVNKM